MMEAKKSMKSTNTDLVVVDRISDLPNSILGVILSFLPTEEVIASSVLSRRWNFVWLTLRNLDFCRIAADSQQDGAENTEFVRYVNRVFLLIDGEKLNRFSLVWHPCIPSHVTSWIHIALARNVCDLSLCLETCFRGFDMPLSAFTCVSLKSLNLTRTNSYIPDELVVCLPRLEILKLDKVLFDSEEGFENLIRSCPMLHSLHMILSFVTPKSCSCSISSTALRRLDLCFGNNRPFLKLKAPSLEYLRFTGELSVEESLGSLVHADFHTMLTEDHYTLTALKPVVDAVRAFDCAKTLTLSASVMLALAFSRLSLSTAFERLVTLELEINYFRSSFHDILQCSTKLEVLIIHQHSNWDDRPEWIAPLEVPVCLSFSLKKVHLDCFRGSKSVMKMIRYMLKNGSALEMMQISYDWWSAGEQSKLLQKIREFPKKSPTCEVQFSVRPSSEFEPLY